MSDDTTLTDAEIEQVLAIEQCRHCGGRHIRACPRVRRLQWHPNGNLASVEFWPDNRWSDAHVIWPEDLEAKGAAPSGA